MPRGRLVLMRLVPILGILACPLLAQPADNPLPSAKPAPRVTAVPLPHHVTSFQLDGRELTACHFDPTDRRVFWHPIRTSRDVSLTRMGHPHDPHGHSHHNSVWISHNDVNGIDFWGDRGKDPGHIVNVEVSREGYEDGDEFASMRMVNHWIRDADGKAQLIEARRAEVRPLDGAKSWLLIIDLEYTTPAAMVTTFGQTYFGLVGVRMAKSIGVLDGGGRILNSEGQLDEEQVFRKPARWCDYSGRITNDADGFAGITLMNHPANPQNPTAFHVRNDGWMCACLSPDGKIEVSETARLRLRYALWAHDGITTQEQSESVWRQFAAMPLADLGPPKKQG